MFKHQLNISSSRCKIYNRKIWVLSQCQSDKIYHRLKTDMNDTGGIYVILFGGKSLSSVRPIQIPKKNRWAPTHEITVSGVHYMNDSKITPGYTVPLSQALGPFHDTIIVPYVLSNPEKTYIAPAYPTLEGNAIADTQICVSGKVEKLEKPIDAAKREIREELGMNSIKMTEIIPHGKQVIINGTSHHLFFASV